MKRLLVLAGLVSVILTSCTKDVQDFKDLKRKAAAPMPALPTTVNLWNTLLYVKINLQNEDGRVLDSTRAEFLPSYCTCYIKGEDYLKYIGRYSGNTIGFDDVHDPYGNIYDVEARPLSHGSDTLQLYTLMFDIPGSRTRTLKFTASQFPPSVLVILYDTFLEKSVILNNSTSVDNTVGPYSYSFPWNGMGDAYRFRLITRAL